MRGAEFIGCAPVFFGRDAVPTRYAMSLRQVRELTGMTDNQIRKAMGREVDPLPHALQLSISSRRYTYARYTAQFDRAEVEAWWARQAQSANILAS